MSYSFIIKGLTKELAKQAVEAEFDKMEGCEPIHARDRTAVVANANAVIDLLVDDDTKDVSVSCNFASWGEAGDLPGVPLHTATIACSASHVARE